MKKVFKYLSLIFIFIISLYAFSINAYAKTEDVKYISETGEIKTEKNVTVLDERTSSLSDDFYVSRSITFEEGIELYNDVAIIMRKGDTLTFKNGIRSYGDTLTIYVQEEDNNSLLSIEYNNDNSNGYTYAAELNLNIYGGKVNVFGKNGSHNTYTVGAIRGNVTIYNGDVTIKSGNGSGDPPYSRAFSGINGNLTVYDGKIQITGARGAGKHYPSDSGSGVNGDVSIYNGDVTITGAESATCGNRIFGKSGSGITGNLKVLNGNVSIIGGKQGDEEEYGNGVDGNVDISGGNVIIKSGKGTGSYGIKKSLNISGGQLLLFDGIKEKVTILDNPNILAGPNEKELNPISTYNNEKCLKIEYEDSEDLLESNELILGTNNSDIKTKKGFNSNIIIIPSCVLIGCVIILIIIRKIKNKKLNNN